MLLTQALIIIYRDRISIKVYDFADHTRKNPRP